MNLTMRKLTTLLALTALVACGGSDASTNPTSIAGTYALRFVNGSSLS